MPFADGSFDAGYATWAYFFSRDWDPDPGLRELHRVLRRGGPLLIVDNLGDDEFTALASHDITADRAYWQSVGFGCQPIATHFEFESMADACVLLKFCFGEKGAARARMKLSFRVGLFYGGSRG